MIRVPSVLKNNIFVLVFNENVKRNGGGRNYSFSLTGIRADYKLIKKFPWETPGLGHVLLQ